MPGSRAARFGSKGLFAELHRATCHQSPARSLAAGSIVVPTLPMPQRSTPGRTMQWSEICHRSPMRHGLAETPMMRGEGKVRSEAMCLASGGEDGGCGSGVGSMVRRLAWCSEKGEVGVRADEFNG